MSSVNRLKQHVERLFNSKERLLQKEMWVDIAKYIVPQQEKLFSDADVAGLTVKNKKRNASLPQQLNIDTASAIHSTLTNPSTEWCNLSLDSVKDSDDEETHKIALDHLQKCNDIMHKAFLDSNLDSNLAKNYQSLTAFGNMCLYEEFDMEKKRLVFHSVHISQVAFDEDKNGDITSFARKFRFTKDQIIEKYGDIDVNGIPLSQKLGKKEEGRKYELLQIIKPRKKDCIKLDEHTGLAEDKHRPIAGYVILDELDLLLEETGYYEQPIFVTRWSVMAGETYGRGIGHIALDDIILLNRATYLTYKGKETKLLPPILVNQGESMNIKHLRAGATIRVTDHSNFREFVSQADTNEGIELRQHLEGNIKSYFLHDKLALPPRDTIGEQTALEVRARLQQMQTFMGSNISRLMRENLEPLVKRTFGLLYRAGMFPETPEALKNYNGAGNTIKIKYKSKLVENLEGEKLDTMDAFINNLTKLSQVFGQPEILETVNLEDIVYKTADLIGMPTDVVKTRKEYREAITKRQQAEQVTSEMNNLKEGSEIAKNLGVSADNASDSINLL